MDWSGNIGPAFEQIGVSIGNWVRIESLPTHIFPKHDTLFHISTSRRSSAKATELFSIWPLREDMDWEVENQEVWVMWDEAP